MAKVRGRVVVGLFRKLHTFPITQAVLEKTLASPLDCKEIQPGSYRRPVLDVHWKDWCWGWNSNTLVTSCEELTHWKRPWCWEGLGAGGEGDDRGWDGWMASPTWCTWVLVNSGSWLWTGRPGMLQFMGSQESDMTERLNWTDLISNFIRLNLGELKEVNWYQATEQIQTLGFSLQVQCSFLRATAISYTI